jgi:hypothetical protein
MEGFYSYRNGMEGSIATGTEWRGYLPEQNGGILAAGHLCLCAPTVSICLSAYIPLSFC